VYLLARKAPAIVNAIIRIDWVHRFFNDRLVNKFGYAAKPRPRPFSLLDDYTSWESLTNKKYTGRHLPAQDKDRALPDIDQVVALWKRKQGEEIPSFDTSLLFGYFAQWFTDSFLRTELFDRRKNNSNHEIDFCQLYGQTKAQTDIIREGKGGRLRYQEIDGEIYPPFLFKPETTTDNWVWACDEFEQLHERKKLEFIFEGVSAERLRQMFVTGLEHGNSNVGYTLMNIVALREHNRIACALEKAYPDWEDDRLFETTRNIMIVVLIKIVAGDYVGHISFIDFPFRATPGMAEGERWYRTNWITLEFDLLYRWHSLVPDVFKVGNNEYGPDDFRSNPGLIIKHGLETLITSSSRQLAGRIGLRNTPGFFFVPAPIKIGGDEHRVDQRSVQERTVQMGRDFKLRTFNEYREAFSLEPLCSFEELTDNLQLAAELRTLYQDIDHVEWHVGIFAEKHKPGAMLGELMTQMVAYDAFTHAFTNPLLSENVFKEETFTKEGLEIINQTNTIADLVRRNVSRPAQTTASFKARRATPGSYGLPIIGRLWDTVDFLFVSGWRKFFEKRQARYDSTVFKVNLFEPTVVILDHQAFTPLLQWDEVLLSKDPRFGWARPPLDLTGGDVPSVFQENPHHAAHKSLYMEILGDQANRLQPTFNEVLDEYLAKWWKLGSFDLADEIERLTASFVFEWYFQARPDIEQVRFVYTHIFAHVPQSLMKLLPWSAYNRSVPMVKELESFIRNSKGFELHLELAIKHGLTDSDALLNQLLFLTGMNNFLGLQGMSKALIGELSQHPELIVQLRSEISEAETVAGRPLLLEELEQLPLLDRTLKELMRLHPPVFFIFGRARQEFTLTSMSGNFVIEEGEQLMGVIPLAQRDPEVFDDPERFNPDRFLNTSLTEYLIWPHGRHAAEVTPEEHVCPGKDVAMLYGKMLCKALVTRCDWELAEPPVWEERWFSLNVASPKGKMRVSRFNNRARGE